VTASGDSRIVYVVHVVVGQDPVRVFWGNAEAALRMAQWLLVEHGQEARVEDVLTQNVPTRTPHEVHAAGLLCDAFDHWEEAQTRTGL
jgi:hypothetical protein